MAIIFDFNQLNKAVLKEKNTDIYIQEAFIINLLKYQINTICTYVRIRVSKNLTDYLTIKILGCIKISLFPPFRCKFILKFRTTACIHTLL